MQSTAWCEMLAPVAGRLNENWYCSLEILGKSFQVLKMGHEHKSFMHASRLLGFTSSFRLFDLPIICDWQCSKTIWTLTPTCSHSQFPFGSRWRTHFSWKEELATLPLSISPEYEDRRFCRSISTSIETNFMDDDGNTGRAIMMTKNVEVEEINPIVGSYAPIEMKTFTSTETVENKDENSLRYPMEILKSPSHRSCLQDHMVSLHTGFIVMVLCNVHPKSWHVNGTRHSLKNMTNNHLFLWIGTEMRKGAQLSLQLSVVYPVASPFQGRDSRVCSFGFPYVFH